MSYKNLLAILIWVSCPLFAQQIEPEWFFFDCTPCIQKLTPEQKKLVEEQFNHHFQQFEYYLQRVDNTAQLIPKTDLKVLALEAIAAATVGGSGMNPTKRVFMALLAVTAQLAKTTWDQYNDFCSLEKKSQYHYEQALWFYKILQNDH